MKYLVAVVVVLALGWFGFTRYLATISAVEEKNLSLTAVAPAVKSPPPISSVPTAAPDATASPTLVAPVATAPSGPAAKPNVPAEPIMIDLAQVLGPGNYYHDDAVGLSLTLPEGWTVRDAARWGINHRENTVFLKPTSASSATPSMYYRAYNPEDAAALASKGAAALLREHAEKKEVSRLARAADAQLPFSDYRNVPDSFSFFDVNGSPAMSYFATFTRDDQVMTEHFIRVLGPRGYVMFFTTGKFEDVKAIMPQLKQAASSVKGP